VHNTVIPFILFFSCSGNTCYKLGIPNGLDS
jgi:hypothetical protein